MTSSFAMHTDVTDAIHCCPAISLSMVSPDMKQAWTLIPLPLYTVRLSKIKRMFTQQQWLSFMGLQHTHSELKRWSQKAMSILINFLNGFFSYAAWGEGTESRVASEQEQ